MKPEAIPSDWATTFSAQRRSMVECQVQTFGVTDHGVIGAMLEVPRERYVDVPTLAYSDTVLGCANGARLLLPPMVLARLIQAAEPRSTSNILDVAGGWGYSAALWAHLSNRVTALETIETMAVSGRKLMAASGRPHVEFLTGPLAKGAAARGPFDIILVNGAIEARPTELLDQLSEGGRLLAIEAERGAPKAIRYERVGSTVSMRPLFDAAAPLLPDFRKARPSFSKGRQCETGQCRIFAPPFRFLTSPA